MTLNKQKTATLLAYLHEQDSEVTRMNYAAPWISNAEYNALRQEFLDWIVGYQAGDLYGTAEDNSTFQFSGIDQFPVPPSR